MYVMTSGIDTGNLPCLHTFDNGSCKTLTWKGDCQHELSSDPYNKNICVDRAYQGYVLNKENRSSNVPVVQEPCIEENGIKRRNHLKEYCKHENSHFKILEKTKRSKHTEFKSLKAGLLGGNFNWNAGSKSSICSSVCSSIQSYRSKPEWPHLQPHISMITNTEDPCPKVWNWMLNEKNKISTTKLIDETLSGKAFDFELDDAPNESSKEDKSCSNSIDPSDVQWLDTQTRLPCNLLQPKISSLIKNEMKLKIQCRRVQEGLPEMPDMHDNSRNTIELSDEEKQRQQQRLNRARHASKNYRRKFKSRETELKEAFTCELQQRTQLQREITLLKQTKDALNNRLQGHNCKHVSTAGVVDVCSSIQS